MESLLGLAIRRNTEDDSAEDFNNVEHVDIGLDSKRATMVESSILFSHNLRLGDDLRSFGLVATHIRHPGVGVAEEKRHGDHFNADDQRWDSNLDIGIGQNVSFFHSVGINQNPE